MARNFKKHVVTGIVSLAMFASVVPSSSFAAIANWEDTNIVYDSDTFGTNGYYNVISKKDYVLVPGAAVESEIVLNNASGTRRQVLHVIEVDPSNPDVSIVPGYYQIDKDLENEANWSHKELTEMAKYYEDNLGYNIVGGMNTDLYYNSYSPRVLVYNGKWIGNAGENVATGGAVLNATSSILYVFQDAEGNISCDVKAYSKADLDKYLADGTLLHAVGVSFGMVVKDGELVKKTEERTSEAAARSMVGVKEDGTLVICMNDGRGANNSVGFCDYEEGEAMLALGCKWAANCDGGGSSTFLTKRVGEESFTMRSVPCDGAQRPTAHGIFVASNVAPTGELDVININSDYDYFAPNTSYEFGAEAIDTHGYSMDMPADVTWALSDDSFGSVENGVFTSNGTTGSVEVQAISNGSVVGTRTINIADPDIFTLSATSTVVPYSTADKIRTISVPVVAMIGESNVYYDTNAVSVTLSDENAGTLDGFNFTATDDTSISGVDINLEYISSGAKLAYSVEFGKGSEVIFDFENGDKAGFMGFEEAKKWSQDNDVKNTLVGSDPLAGQFNEYLSSDTFTVTTKDGGQVRNGDYALAWKLDNTDASFAGWSYNVLFNTGDTIVLRDVANGMKATTLGMWLYIPEGAPGLAFQSQLYAKNADGTYACKQDHFMFTSAATGKQTNLNSATEADIPESRWVYATIDISNYDYLCTPVATDTSQSRSPSFLRTYVKPTAPAELTFYIDDITLDYSSAVDDRVLPTIAAPTYSTSDTAVSLDNGTVINGNKVAFSAAVSDNYALDLTSGKIFVDGVEINAAITGGVLSSKEDAVLVAGIHTVAFEVKDELGNPAKLTRTFTVAGDAVVEISGHNESGETPKAQSVYYVDINAADLANVNKLTVDLKLNNANVWETEGAIIADGFKADFDYNEISEILSVTVEKTGVNGKALNNTLVSIPVRVWTFDRYNYVNNTYYDPAGMGNKPVVNIECDVVHGEISLTDKTTSPFGGSINVATELTTISSPYHIHDEELTVLNLEPTAITAGYENRTFCETCKSVVDWGTILEPSGHSYEIVDGQFVCSDEGCGHIYESGTGIFEMNDKLYYSINGVLKTGWNDVDGKYCYAGSDYSLYIGTQIVSEIIYEFDENGVTNGAWVTSSDGKLKYSYGPKFYPYGWQEIDGEKYFFGNMIDGGYAYTGVRSVLVNPNSPKAGMNWYEFAEDGKYIRDINDTGFYTDSATYNTCYLIDGKTQMTGFTKIGDDYYYFSTTNGKMAVNVTRVVAIDCVDSSAVGYITENTKLTFGADGKLVVEEPEEPEEIKKNGIIDGYYYVDDVIQKTGFTKIGEDYYYFSTTNGKMAVNITRVVAIDCVDSSAAGYITENTKLTFDADGKLVY